MELREKVLEEIVDGCRQGESSAQRRLYELYAKQMTALCMRYTSDYEAARDLMHDGFIKIFTQIDKFEGRGSFEGWMKRIFLNLSLDYLKKKINHIELDQVDYMLEDETSDFVGGIDAERIYEAIKKLPSGCRVVFNMFNIDGYSIKEISEKLGMTSVAVRSQNHRAKERLKELLKDE